MTLKQVLPAASLFLTGVAPAVMPPQQVISLAPSLTQMIRELGAEDRLVAVTPWCEAPANIPPVAGGIQPEVEAVLGLAPDLVLATSMTPATTRNQLSQLGLRVEVIDATSLEEIQGGLARLADILETKPPPPLFKKSVRTELSAALLFGAETGYSAGCGTHAHEILEAAGLRNIAAEAGGPWPQLGEEFLLAKDPQVIIVAEYGNTDRATVLQTLRADPVRRHLAAVRNGRIIVFPAQAFSVPGPAALEAAETLRAALENL